MRGWHIDRQERRRIRKQLNVMLKKQSCCKLEEMVLGMHGVRREWGRVRGSCAVYVSYAWRRDDVRQGPRE